MSQNGQSHFKNLVAFAARFLKYVWPFWDIIYQRVNATKIQFYLQKQVFYKRSWSQKFCNIHRETPV